MFIFRLIVFVGKKIENRYRIKGIIVLGLYEIFLSYVENNKK